MPTGWQAYRPSSDEVPYVKWRHARSPLALERAHYPLSRNSKTYRGGSQSSPNNPLAQGARTAFAGEEGRARRTKSISPVSISGETPALARSAMPQQCALTQAARARRKGRVEGKGGSG